MRRTVVTESFARQSSGGDSETPARPAPCTITRRDGEQRLGKPFRFHDEHIVDSFCRQSRPSQRRILVVEDNPDGRETLRLLLSLLGHRVEVAADASEGFRRALSWKPEIVFIDIGLPDLDGYQLAEALRRELGWRTTLIAHTGYGRPEDRRRSLESGFDAHLTKPVDLPQLRTLLERPPKTLGNPVLMRFH